jgi:hypothetical protein
MEKFLFKPDGNEGLCKLPNEWRLLESLRHYFFLIHLKDFGDEPINEPYIKAATKIISYGRQILKRKISEDDFIKVYKEIREIFFHKNAELKNSITKSMMDLYLGPLGFKNSRVQYDIDDFEEVYVEANTKTVNRDYTWGCIKSKSCGWAGWILVHADKAKQKNFLTSINHFKKETLIDELFQKYAKFKNEKIGRSLKRFFISNTFWYHDDYEKFEKGFKAVMIDNYADIMGAFITGNDHDE